MRTQIVRKPPYGAGMDIILVPGLWLNASSWDAVVPHLEAAGHRAHALTLPGMESKAADRAGITVEDHIATIVDALDDADGPALLVGHSAGSGLVWAAVDARPDLVARVVYVGGFPGGDGEPLLSGLPAEDGEVAMPDWKEMGEDANVVDFDPAQLQRLYAEAIPVPEAVITTPITLTDDRRYGVPATAICPEYTSGDLRSWIAGGDLPELARTAALDVVDLPGGHWPQLTQPEALAAALIEAAAH
jgi:pimeloyl-ACP methyl ester carboxylesterase